MKIDKLKNKVIIGGVIIGLVGVATILFSLTKPKLTESINIINNKENYKVPDSKIIAIYKSEDGINYSEITDRIPSSGYTINESKSYCNLNNEKDANVRLYTNSAGEHIISNVIKGDKCYLYFDKKAPTASETILDNITLATSGPDFSKIATGNETSNDGNSGIYQIADGMYDGTSTYWRGATLTNYVKFAGYCWRIVRINGDGSLRLIYDGASCHDNGANTTDNIAIINQAYNSNYDRSEYVGWTYEVGNQRTLSETASNAKIQLENWYNSNLKSYENEIVDGKFCNDRNITSGYSWSSQSVYSFNYAAIERLQTNKIPTLSCPEADIYILKIGLITADEVAYAGGVSGQINRTYYLYNNQSYWTMSPCFWDYIDSSRRWARVFRVENDGKLTNNAVHVNYGFRPVINLRSDVTFSGGTGVQSDPYIVS